MPDIDEQFWALVEQATQYDLDHHNAPDQEPFLERVLDFVVDHPEHKERFVRHFVSLALRERPVSEHLVPYCMRTLRWPEVLAAVNEALSVGFDAFEPNRAYPLLKDARDAYQDHWGDAVFWERYEYEVEEPTPRQSWWRRLLGR